MLETDINFVRIEPCHSRRFALSGDIPEMKARLFFDAFSSVPNDDLYIDSYSDSIEKYKNVFKEIFYISGHIAHYNMMMGIDDKTVSKE